MTQPAGKKVYVYGELYMSDEPPAGMPATGGGVVMTPEAPNDFPAPPSADGTAPAPEQNTTTPQAETQPEPAPGTTEPAGETQQPGTDAGEPVNTAPAGPPFPGELRRDDSQHTPDENVRLWQQAAANRGVSVGPVDGFFGPLTEAGVRAMQGTAGREQSGVIDEATWSLPWA
jgi:Putative peptidoglycan binding domain